MAELVCTVTVYCFNLALTLVNVHLTASPKYNFALRQSYGISGRFRVSRSCDAERSYKKWLSGLLADKLVCRIIVQ